MTHKITRLLLKLLPERLGHRLILALSGRTEEVALLPAESEAMTSAKAFRYGPDGGNAAFEWGNGPLVILVHGWGGRAAQMAPLAARLADRGYRCVAPDITGHGETAKRFTRWRYFLRDIEALTRSLRSGVYAYVGHSSGGTTMMAVRRHGGIKAQRYVCICSPSYPFLSIDSLRQNFDPGERMVDRHKQYLADEFGIAWPDLESGGSFSGAGENLLLFYDERDRLVPHSEGDRIHALCTGSRLIKTDNYGHRRVLTAPELYNAVIKFLAESSAEL